MTSATRQKEHHAALGNDLIQTYTYEPEFLKKVISGNELWENCVRSQGAYSEGD